MTSHCQDKTWTERAGYSAQSAAPTDDINRALNKQGFQRPHTAMGGVLGLAGHWVALAGAMSPIVIGEFIPDPAKRCRATRLTAVGTAVAYEALYAIRELRNEQNARLVDCETRGEKRARSFKSRSGPLAPCIRRLADGFFLQQPPDDHFSILACGSAKSVITSCITLWIVEVTTRAPALR